MKTGTTDSGIIKMNDKSRLQIRIRYQGHFPQAISAALEEAIAETIHTYLRDGVYRTANLCKNTQLVTEVLSMELDEIQATFPTDIRYTHIVYKGDMALSNVKDVNGNDTVSGSLLWNVEVHLEQAIAPCRISIEMIQLAADDERA